MGWMWGRDEWENKGEKKGMRGNGEEEKGRKRRRVWFRTGRESEWEEAWRKQVW